MQKTILFILVLLIYNANIGCSQFTTIQDLGALLYPHSRELGQFGDNKLFRINTSAKYLLQTDGTKAGTKIVGNFINNEKYLQISPDSCIRISEDSLGTKIQIFAADQTQPTEFVISIDVNAPEFVDNKLVFRYSAGFAILDLSNGDLIKKAIPNINFFWLWFLIKDYIIVSSMEGEIFKISLVDLNVSSIIQTDFEELFLKTPMSDSLFLYVTHDSLFVSNATSSQFLLKTPSFSTFRPRDNILIDGIFYFEYINESGISYFLRSDGTPDSTIVLTSQEPFEYDHDVSKFALNGKPFFYSNNYLWTLDSTNTGLQKAIDHMIYGSFDKPLKPSNNRLFYFSTNDAGFQIPYIFDGITSKRVDSSSKRKANFEQNWNLPEAVIGDKNIYLPLVDIDYGRELHRYNYVSDETSLVYDISPYGNWSNLILLGEVNNHLIGILHQANTIQLVSFDKSTPDVPPAPVHKNYHWAECLQTRAKPTKKNGITDSKGNYYNSIYESLSIRPIYLTYNRQVLYPKQNNRIIKLTNQGAFDWTTGLPDQDQATPIAINSRDELVTALRITNHAQIQDQNYDPTNGNLLILTFNESGQIIHSAQFDIGINGQIDDVAINNKNEIFLTGKFSGKTAQFDQHTIQSDRNIATFLLKLSDTGQTIWANAYPLPFAWPIDKGTSPIGIGPERVYFLQRIGDTQRHTECQNNRYRFRINAVQQSTGKTLWENEYISKDFSFPIDLAASSKEHLTLIGSYMEEIQFDNTILTSDSCNQTNFFQIKIAPQGTLLEAKRLATDYTFFDASHL